MKKYYSFPLFLFMIMLIACNPRIEMDLSVWGDHAYIDNVQIIKMETNDAVKLSEWYTKQLPLTGVRIITISKGNAVIDSTKRTAIVTLNSGELLDYAAIKIYHKSQKVEPVNNSPKAGLINNLAKKEFQYRLFSADGTERDWTIIIQ